MKYIIDIPKTVGMTEKVGSVHYTYFDGIQCQTIILKSDEIEELNSDYINEHYGQLQDEAYKRGYDDATKIIASDEQSIAEKAYQQGLEDAWECAKKLFSTMSDTEIEKVFPVEWKSGFSGLMQMKPQYAMAKIKAYEEKQNDKIEVGNEVVVTDRGTKYIVVSFGENTACGFTSDGIWTGWELNKITKTGRYFDVASILKEMKNES